MASEVSRAARMNVLFITPDEREVYARSYVKADLIHLPALAVASLGAVARQNQATPTVLDLTLADEADRCVEDHLQRLHPRWVCLTCMTPTYEQAVRVARLVKRCSPESQTVVGGPHVSFLPHEALDAGCFDYVVVGEGEQAFAQLLRNEDPRTIAGVALRAPDGSHQLCAASLLRDLDELPIPDYGLYPLGSYPLSPFYVRHNPAVWIETGRGCPFRCKYCSKGVHGSRLRNKSPERVVSEMRQLVGLGVRELFLADNGFTDDMRRAERICDLLIDARLGCGWDCVNGIRVDRVNQTLLDKMHRAGCHQISFGIESGNQGILDRNGKGISLRAAEAAVAMAKRAGIFVWGFFLMGFPDETEETLRDTIRFATRLPLDIAKVNIIIPYPDSPLYAEYAAAGLMHPGVSYREFNSNTSPRQIYRHPSLSWDCIERSQMRFYRRFYFNPRFLARRVLLSAKRGMLLRDVRSMLRVDWFRR